MIGVTFFLTCILLNQNTFGLPIFPKAKTSKPSDFTHSMNKTCTTDFPSTSCRIAKDLTGLKPEEIKVYGLSDYPVLVVRDALMFLNPGNITKVLLNLPSNELIQIRDSMSPSFFNHTLSLVTEPQRSEILNKSSAG